MKLTVAICTWNRSRVLRQALEQLTHLAPPGDWSWEVLVVNNNSTDDTDAVIDSFRARLPVRRLFEPEQGLSNARNCAVANASGDYILWTDDDILVGETWLDAYRQAIISHPEAAVLGGPIVPHFEGTPPAWLVQTIEKVRGAYALVDLGTAAFALEPDPWRLPYGGNFAVKTSVQRQFPYSPRLGKVGDEIRYGEEIQLILAVLRAGHAGRWVPTARVRHVISKDRQTVRYLKRCYFGHGQTQALHGQGRDAPSFLGRPRWLWRRLPVVYALYLKERVFGRPPQWVNALIQYRICAGYFHACGQLNRRAMR